MPRIAAFATRCLEKIAKGWSSFWFTPRRAETLGVLRVLIGLCLLYNLSVYGIALEELLGNSGWVDPSLFKNGGRAPFNISYLNWLPIGNALTFAHWIAIGIAVLLTFGAWTTVTAPLSLFVQLSYVNRNELTLFGFDYVLTMMLFYLAIGPCGRAYSLDSWRHRHQPVTPSIGANLSIRLMQVHMAWIYFLSGIGKHGPSWLDGTAMQRIVGTFETSPYGAGLLVDFPNVLAALGFITMISEISFPFLVWSRRFRPWILASMLIFHIGVAWIMRLPSFSIVMMIGCASFANLDGMAKWLWTQASRASFAFREPDFSSRNDSVNSKAWIGR